MSRRKNRSTPEPTPITTDEPAVIDLIIADIEGTFMELDYGVLIPHLLDRKAFGIKKYGTPLQVSNGRDHRHDAFQEIQDMLAYLRQGVERGDENMKVFYYQAIVMAAEFAELIDGGEFDYNVKKKTVLNPQ